MPTPKKKPARVIPIRKAEAPKLKYDCNKCPAYCCSYPLIEITRRDVARLGKHFALSFEQAEKRFTRWDKGQKSHALRHRKDRIFKSVCMFLDQKKRQCTVYHARPGVCRVYPDTKRCGYYEFLKFERGQQDDPKFIALT